MHLNPCLPHEECDGVNCNHCCHIRGPSPRGTIAAHGCYRIDHSATNTFPEAVTLRKGILDQPAPDDWEALAVQEQFEAAQRRAYEKEKREGRASAPFKKLQPNPLKRRVKQVLGYDDYVGVYVWHGLEKERFTQKEKSSSGSGNV